MSRVLLVKPPFARLLQSDVYLTLPLGAMYVAAMLRDRGHEVRIWHDDVSNTDPIPRAGVRVGPMEFASIDYSTYEPLQKVLDEWRPEVVGISYCTVDAEAAHAIASEVRRRGIRTVGGGIHPSLLPDDELEWFDAVVIGEGDQPHAAAAFEKDTRGVFFVQPKENLDDLRPARDAVIHGSRYSPFLRGMVQTQRGCPYNCGYCAAPKVFGRRVRTRDPGLVREEVECLDTERGRIIDDSFAVKRKHGMAICRELAKTNYRWVCDIALQDIDEELLAAMAEAGCQQVNIGIESAVERWQDVSGKFIAPGRPEAVAAMCQRENVGMVAYFIIGYPGETFDELQQTLRYAEHLKGLGAHPCISVLTPYPGTRIWDMVAPQLDGKPWTDFIHQSSAMGFADCTEDQWASVLEEANRVGV